LTYKMDSAGVLPLKTASDFTDIRSTSSVMVNWYTPRDRVANTKGKKRITATDVPLEDLVFDI
jgi:hypothetical protein